MKVKELVEFSIQDEHVLDRVPPIWVSTRRCPVISLHMRSQEDLPCIEVSLQAECCSFVPLIIMRKRKNMRALSPFIIDRYYCCVIWLLLFSVIEIIPPRNDPSLEPPSRCDAPQVKIQGALLAQSVKL